MSLDDITLGLFAASNGLRIVAYVPQIRKAATDDNGASAISYMTWVLFLLANLSTVAYALINRGDVWLAGCFTANALCCLSILIITFCNRRRHTQRLRHASCLASDVRVEAHPVAAGDSFASNVAAVDGEIASKPDNRMVVVACDALLHKNSDRFRSKPMNFTGPPAIVRGGTNA